MPQPATCVRAMCGESTVTSLRTLANTTIKRDQFIPLWHLRIADQAEIYAYVWSSLVNTGQSIL